MSDVNNPVLGYADSYRREAKRGQKVADIWSVIADLERNIAPLFAAAQSELAALAALREELAKFDEGMRALACSLGAGGYNAETLTADQLVGKVQWGIDNIITVQEQRLAAAEQRNSELEVFERFAGYLLDHCEGETIYEESLQSWLNESIKLYKPTESGASE